MKANDRGIWQADQEKMEKLQALYDLTDAELEKLQALYDLTDAELEGVTV